VPCVSLTPNVRMMPSRSCHTKVGLVSNSNFTAPHAHRPVDFFGIASSFVTTGLSVIAIALTGGTSTLIRPRTVRLHYSSADNFSRSCRTSDVAVCWSRASANSRTRNPTSIATGPSYEGHIARRNATDFAVCLQARNGSQYYGAGDRHCRAWQRYHPNR
jgi:hypothetical protein